MIGYRDGQPYELSPEEEAEVIARREAAANAPPPVPAYVEMRQARLALLAAGLLPTVDAAFQALEGPNAEADKIQWEYATVVTRANPLMLTMAQMLGMTEEQIDDLFRAAAAIP